MEYVGPMLAVGHVPCDLAPLRRGDVQGFEATFWLPVDCNLVSLICQKTSKQQTVSELSALARLPQQLLPDLVMMDGPHFFATVFLVTLVLIPTALILLFVLILLVLILLALILFSRVLLGLSSSGRYSGARALFNSCRYFSYLNECGQLLAKSLKDPNLPEARRFALASRAAAAAAFACLEGPGPPMLDFAKLVTATES